MFKVKELEALIEAVESWEEGESGIGDVVIGAMFSGLMGDDEEAQAKHKKQMEERERKRAEEKLRRKKLGASIRYKLYELLEEAQELEIKNLQHKEQE